MDFQNTLYGLFEIFGFSESEEVGNNTEQNVQALKGKLSRSLHFTAGLITGNQSQKQMNKIIKLLKKKND